jgi:hypothetical protein
MGVGAAHVDEEDARGAGVVFLMREADSTAVSVDSVGSAIVGVKAPAARRLFRSGLFSDADAVPLLGNKDAIIAAKELATGAAMVFRGAGATALTVDSGLGNAKVTRRRFRTGPCLDAVAVLSKVPESVGAADVDEEGARGSATVLGLRGAGTIDVDEEVATGGGIACALRDADAADGDEEVGAGAASGFVLRGAGTTFAAAADPDPDTVVDAEAAAARRRFEGRGGAFALTLASTAGEGFSSSPTEILRLRIWLAAGPEDIATPAAAAGRTGEIGAAGGVGEADADDGAGEVETLKGIGLR